MPWKLATEDTHFGKGGAIILRIKSIDCRHSTMQITSTGLRSCIVQLAAGPELNSTNHPTDLPAAAGLKCSG